MAARTLPSNWLRNILLGDALVSGCVMVLLIVGAGALGLWIGAPAVALRLVGLALISWAALLLWTGSGSPVPLLAVWTVIILNAAGALACALLAWGLRDTLTAFGTGFMVVNGVGALLLALGQYQGLQRSSPAGA